LIYQTRIQIQIDIYINKTKKNYILIQIQIGINNQIKSNNYYNRGTIAKKKYFQIVNLRIVNKIILLQENQLKRNREKEMIGY